MRARGLIWPLLSAGAAAVALLARRRLDVVEVRGRSMAPTLMPGDRLLVARIGAARAGDIVVSADPRNPRRELIKRVAGVAHGRVTLRGDNSMSSTDARTFGPVAAAEVRWRVIARYWPLDAAGRVPDPPAAPRVLTPIDEGGEQACTLPEALIAGD